MLGIVIGVGAVITMIGGRRRGAERSIAEQIASLGSNLMHRRCSGAITSGGVRLGLGSQMTLSEDDAAAIAREVPRCALSPRRRCAAVRR